MTADNLRYSLWRRFVAVLRLVAIATLTAVIVVTLASGRVMLRGGARRRWRIWHFRYWSRGVCRLLGGRTTLYGSVPDAPFFLASNHLSYLDILVLAQHLPCVFVSKAEVAQWPVVGFLTGLADTLYIDRARRADIPATNAAIKATLQQGDSIALFPEGTSSAGDSVLPIRAPLLQVAASSDIGVNTAAIHYQTAAGDRPASHAIAYYGDHVFGPHLWQLLHLRGFTATIKIADTPLHDTDRKQLAIRVGSQLRELLARIKAHAGDPAYLRSQTNEPLSL